MKNIQNNHKALPTMAWRIFFVFIGLLVFSAVRARATDVEFNGEESWSASDGYITINSAEVENEDYGGESGTLELVVWATKDQYEGGEIYGYKLGTYTLGQLDGGSYFYDISGTVPYSPPPDGVYFTTMTVEEWDGSEYVIDDYVNFGYEGFGVATPPATCTITTRSSPPDGGTTSGGGVYDYGDDIDLTATPNPGFRFVQWDYAGALLSREEDPTYVAKANYAFVAVFAPLPEQVTLIVDGIGKIKHSFNPNDVLVGHTYTVTAVPGKGQLFTGWSGSYYSSSAKLTFVMELGTTLQANFTSYDSTGGDSGSIEPTIEDDPGESASQQAQIEELSASRP